MAISLVGVGTLAENGALEGDTGLEVPLPAGVQDNDFLVIQTYRDDNTDSFDTLTDWDLVQYTKSTGEDMQVAFYTKVAENELTNPTITHSDTSQEQWAARMMAFRGVDTDNPFDVTYVEGDHLVERINIVSPNTQVAQPITTNNDDAWVLILEAVSQDEVSSNADPSGYTNIHRNLGSGNNHRQMQAWYQEIGTAGTETPGAAGWTSGNDDQDAIYITLALRAAVDSGIVPEGWQGIELTSIHADSVLSGLYAVGDTWITRPTTTPGGYDVNLLADGRFWIDAGGDTDRQEFDHQVYEASISPPAYDTGGTIYVNNDAPALSGSSYFNSSNDELIRDVNVSFDMQAAAVDTEGDTVTVSLISGSVPTGMSFGSSGLTGTPTATGTYNFTWRAEDDIGDSNDYMETVSVVLLTEGSSINWSAIISAADDVAGS